LTNISLDFVQQTHLLPELGLGQNGVLGEDPHGENLGFGNLRSGFRAAGDQELSDIHVHSFVSVGFNHFNQIF